MCQALAMPASLAFDWHSHPEFFATLAGTSRLDWGPNWDGAANYNRICTRIVFYWSETPCKRHLFQSNRFTLHLRGVAELRSVPHDQHFNPKP